MGIDIKLVDEGGRVHAQYLDRDDRVKGLVERASEASLSLRFIDPYGNTTFNYLQAAQLLTELQALDVSEDALDLRDRISSLAREVATGEPGRYLQFVGD